ncbi:MAG: hypothetical protein WD844_16275 [Thermoleophilaceae bacterium]
MHEWTQKQKADAQRAAIRLAIAAHKRDGEQMAAILNDANLDALVEQLAVLPSILLLSLEQDPNELLGELLDNYPDVIDPQEN